MPTWTPWDARADADFILGTTTYQSGLPNSIPLSALSVPINLNDDIPLRFGAPDVYMEWNTGQTTDALTLALSGSNNFIIGTVANLITSDYDLGLADSTNPQLVITSATAWSSAGNKLMRGRLYHDGTNFNIISDTGSVVVNDELIVTTNILPDAANTDTVGSPTYEFLSFYAGDGSTSGLYLGTSQSAHLYYDSALILAGTLNASNAAGPAFADEAATTTNPTLIPDKAEMDTGIGWASDTLHFILGGTSYANLSTTLLTLAGDIQLTGGGTIQNDTGDIVIDSAGAVNLDMTSVSSILWAGVPGIKLDDSAITTYAATNAVGTSVFARFQDGAANGAGIGYAAGTVTVTTGTGGNGTGAAGGAGGSLAVVLGQGGTGTSTGAQGTMTVNGPVSITPATAAAGLTINQDYTSVYAADITCKYGIQITCDITGGQGLVITRNLNAAESLPLVSFKNDHASDTKATLSLQNDGTSATSFHITTGATNENLRLGPNGTGEVWFAYNSIQNLHMSGAAVAAYSALTNVDGASCYIAMQSGLDNNKNGGSLYWSGGTAHGSGTGGSLFLTPGGTTSGTRGAVVVYQSGLAVTSTNALSITNSTAATDGVKDQMSGSLRFRGYSWTGAASQSVDFFLENLPANAATPTGTFKLGYSLNGAAATYPMTITSAGVVTLLNAGALNTGTTDSDYYTLGAVDNDTQAITECIRLAGADEPYALLTRAKFSTSSHAADVGHRGMLYVTEGGAGAADVLYWVAKGADNNYTAIQVAIG